MMSDIYNKCRAIEQLVIDIQELRTDIVHQDSLSLTDTTLDNVLNSLQILKKFLIKEVRL